MRSSSLASLVVCSALFSLSSIHAQSAQESSSQSPAAASGASLPCESRPVQVSSPAKFHKVSGKSSGVVTLHVAIDGSGEFKSIQCALNAAPSSGAVLLIAPGVYREVLTIDKPNIQLRGVDPDASKTVVVNDRSAGANGGTLHSSTVNVTADNFLAENITFENDFNRTHPQLPAGSQALALFVTGDRAVFHHVRLLGNQDTVYLGSRNCAPDGDNCIPTRQYFSDSLIAGNVDFIFGDSKAVFDLCEIRSTAHEGGYVTAQSKHYEIEDSGFVFRHCKLTADPGVNRTVYLGRPWRPYASVVYLNTEMGSHIDPAGFREWHPGETHSLQTVFYAEYSSTGPGAHPAERDPHIKMLTAEEARKFEPAVFLRGADGWNPEVPVAPPH